MSDVVQNTQPEFWRAPSPLVSEEEASPATTSGGATPAMAEACSRCGTEFLLGARFCHTCGARRSETVSPRGRADAADIARLWEQTIHRVRSVITGIPWKKIQFPAWLRYLHFHEIQRFVGLSTASLIALVIGMGCVAGALLVGLLTAKTFVDWQAIQFYRAEWLLAATASFVAGILFKKPSDRDRD